MIKILCNLCGAEKSKLLSTVRSKPDLETDYSIASEDYLRQIHLCQNCGVYFNHYKSDLLSQDFYGGKYNASIGSGKLKDRFDKIISIPFANSDNKQRVDRITGFLYDYYATTDILSILDVGSGTGVFLHELSKTFPNISCVDPDINSISFIKENIKIKNSWIGSLLDVPRDQTFNLITFNKVLEHVDNPIQMLLNSHQYLKRDALIYVELPFSDYIVQSQTQDIRAEFFIEHLTIYNLKSLSYLLKNGGFKSIGDKIIIEPSGKHTIYTFAERI